MERYWYRIGLYAEGTSEGWIQLTEDEAKLVDMASNPDNWHLADLESYSGSLSIDLNSKRKTKPNSLH